MNDLAKNLLLWVVIAIVLMTVFNNFGPQTTSEQSIDYSVCISEVQQGQVQRVEIEGHTVQGVRVDGSLFTTQTPPDDPQNLRTVPFNEIPSRLLRAFPDLSNQLLKISLVL